MTLLTSAECREIAERKMVEAESDPAHGKEFRAMAHAWLVLAEMIEQAEAGLKAAMEYPHWLIVAGGIDGEAVTYCSVSVPAR